jgi:hypothetical protein
MVICEAQIVFLMTILHDCLKAESSVGNMDGAYIIRPSYSMESMAEMYDQLVKQQPTELKDIKDE